MKMRNNKKMYRVLMNPYSVILNYGKELFCWYRMTEGYKPDLIYTLVLAVQLESA